jgi:outer membrane protein assembly factor BamB
MKNTIRTLAVVSSCALLLSAPFALAQNWPQWLGENRDGKAAFTPPRTWPKELAQKWKVTVGDGVATPALVGDKLYVFTRENNGELLRCLDAASGKELWQSEKYDVLPATGGPARFTGPRCSPTVADGKVVTLGLRGMLTCYDAATGKQLWRKEDFKNSQLRFFTGSSPVVAEGLCIAQLGNEQNGGVVAYDLSTGKEEWRWTGDGPGYASPVLQMVAGTKMIIADTNKKIVGLGVKDGKLLWEMPYAAQGMGNNASTPIVDGSNLYYAGSGRGVTAAKIEREGDSYAAKELWKNMDNSVQFNTPVLVGGALYGLAANNNLFCVNAKDGKTAWTSPFAPSGASADSANDSPGEARGPGPGGGRRGGGGGGRGGFGQIVAAGSVLLALTPASELIAFQPSDKSYIELARLKVSSTPTYACPVVSGNRIFIKDQNDVMLYTVE